MIGILFLLFSALSAAFGVVLIRQGLDESNFFSAAFVLTFIGNVILVPLAIVFTPLETVNLVVVLLFAIAGILQPM